MKFESSDSVSASTVSHEQTDGEDVLNDDALEYLDPSFGNQSNSFDKKEYTTEETESVDVVPEQLLSTEILKNSLKSEDFETIYQWYADAISRRDREPISKESFIHHFFEGGAWESTYAKGDMEKGFIFGYYKFDIFIPTHFAPKSIRTGYELFKEMADDSEVAVATTVTDDLAETLLKMKGWNKLNVPLFAYFNSELQKKVLVYNNSKGIKFKLAKLMLDFKKEMKAVEE